MRKLLFLLAILLLAASTAGADDVSAWIGDSVIVERYQPAEWTACPSPKIAAHWDWIEGRRVWVPEHTDLIAVITPVCAKPAYFWKERWSDWPDKGGIFIEVVQ